MAHCRAADYECRVVVDAGAMVLVIQYSSLNSEYMSAIILKLSLTVSKRIAKIENIIK